MELEERNRGEIQYAERRISGVLELKGYKVSIRENFNNNNRQRAVIIPLPPNFDFSGINLNPGYPPPNCIVIVDDKLLKKNIVKKIWRPERVFREKGYPQARIIKVKEGVVFSSNSIVWFSREKYYKITKQDLYIDKYYINRLFGED